MQIAPGALAVHSTNPPRCAMVRSVCPGHTGVPSSSGFPTPVYSRRTQRFRGKAERRFVMGKRTVLVLGVTGQQGGATARHLLAGGWHVRGLTRDASSPGARRIEALG